MAISTNGTIITRLAGALYNEYLSNASYLELKDTAAATVAANMLTNDFAGKTDAQLATTILKNLGLSSITGLDNWVAAQLTAAGSSAASKGAKLVSMLNDYAMMTADATYGSYATSFNSKTDASLVKSQTAGTKSGSFATSDVVAVANSSLTLTSGIDTTLVGGAGDDTYSATHATFQSGDILDGGAGADTLKIVDTGTAAWTLPTGALVSNIETIRLKNVNTPSTATAGSTETATIQFKDLSASETVTLAGVRFTAGIGGATAAQVASAFVDGTITATTAAVAGGVLTDAATGTPANADTRAEVTALLTAGGYTIAAGGTSSSVKVTSTTASTNVTDIVAGGSSVTGVKHVSTITLATNPGDADNTLSFKVNGISVTTVAAGAANATGLGTLTDSVATNINSALGKLVAFSDGKSVVHVISDTPITIGDFSKAGTTNTTTFTPALANEKQTLTFATIPGSATQAISLVLNGVSYTTAATADTVENVRDKIFDVINAAIPGVATKSSTDKIVLDGEGSQGISLSKVAAGNTTTSVGTTTASRGSVTANAPVITVTNGVAATSAGTSTDTLDASKFVGSTSIVNEQSTGDVSISAIASTQSVTIEGNGAITNGATTATFGTTVASPVVNLKGGTTANTSGAGNLTITSAGASTVTINSTDAPLTSTGLTGTNSVGAFSNTGTATSTLQINATSNFSTGTNTVTTSAKYIKAAGSATSVTLGALTAANLTEIDASGLTAGGMSVALLDAITSFKGGAGTDTVTTAANLSSDAIIDAGGGTSDVLVMRAAADIDTALEAAKYRNFETLRVMDTYDTSLVAGITKLQLAAMTSKTVSGISAAQASSITVRGDQTTALTLTMANASGTSDSMTLNLSHPTTSTANVDVAGLSIVGVETLNVNATTGAATGTGASDISFASGGADKLTALTFSGAPDIGLSGSNITKPVTVTNSGSGKFTVSGNFATGSVINGSATGINAYTIGNVEGVTYVGGAEKDTFAMTEALLLADGTTDTIINGGSNIDTVSFTETTVALTDAHFTNVSNMEKLTVVGTSGGTLTTGGSFKTAYPTGVEITSGTVANGSTTTWNMGLYDKAITLALTTAADGATTADNVIVTTGSGNDIVTITASSWVGHATTNGLLEITTGAGNDVISVTTGTLLANANAGKLTKITGGLGADNITVTHVNAGTGTTGNMTFAVGVSDSPTSGYDAITGFKMSDIGGSDAKLSDGLDFAAVRITQYAATAANGFAASEFTVAVSSAGLVTFGGTKASSASLAEKIAAVQSVVTTTDGDSAVFTHGADSFAFNNNALGDTVVHLVGIQAEALITTNDATTNNGIYIL